jgi:hypothetical protein
LANTEVWLLHSLKADRLPIVLHRINNIQAVLVDSIGHHSLLVLLRVNGRNNLVAIHRLKGTDIKDSAHSPGTLDYVIDMAVYWRKREERGVTFELFLKKYLATSSWIYLGGYHC